MSSDSAEWYANGVAVVAAVISAFSLLTSLLAVWFGRKQASIAQKALLVAECEAGTTRAALEQTRLMSERSTRAWLIVSEFQILTPLPPIGAVVFRASVVVKNVGSSPAKDVSVISKIRRNEALPTAIDITENHGVRSSFVLGSGEVTSSLHDLETASDYVEDIRAGDLKLSLYGLVIYQCGNK